VPRSSHNPFPGEIQKLDITMKHFLSSLSLLFVLVAADVKKQSRRLNDDDKGFRTNNERYRSYVTTTIGGPAMNMTT
jgi:hypothetical protein